MKENQATWKNLNEELMENLRDVEGRKRVQKEANLNELENRIKQLIVDL